MKKIVYAILIIFLSLPLSGYTIKGGVTYTVEQARQEAFANVEYTLPQSIIDANKVDPNYDENMKAKAKGKKKLFNRRMIFFSDGAYCVIYKNNPCYSFYYLENGELDEIGKKTSLHYPSKVNKYNIKGKLETISYIVTPKDTFMFDVTGKLIVHWINNKCYDLNGNLVLERY